MKIAFYAPLKSPHHPVPSGDRQMARALVKSLEFAGHEVEIASELRCFSKTPHEKSFLDKAEKEAAGIITRWAGDVPDLWFSYHPYYKAPDFVALEILKSVTIPVFTAESSLASKRDVGEWASSQDAVRNLLKRSHASFYFTDRDLPGLQTVVRAEKLIRLSPFIDIPASLKADKPETPAHKTVQLVAMGMMREGVKFDSYEMLANALALIRQADWHLTIIGDGKMRSEVERLFEHFADDKISWTGEVLPGDVHAQLLKGDIFVWPGFGEAYGLAYLEAQAAGLPVVAQNTHGVPFAVKDGETGILVASGDERAYAQAVLKLIETESYRQQLGKNAKEFVLSERNLKQASDILDGALRKFIR